MQHYNYEKKLFLEVDVGTPLPKTVTTAMGDGLPFQTPFHIRYFLQKDLKLFIRIQGIYIFIEFAEIIKNISTLVENEKEPTCFDINLFRVGKYAFETDSFVSGFFSIKSFCAICCRYNRSKILPGKREAIMCKYQIVLPYLDHDFNTSFDDASSAFWSNS